MSPRGVHGQSIKSKEDTHNESNVMHNKYYRFTCEGSPVPFPASSHFCLSQFHQRHIFWACDIYSFGRLHQQEKHKKFKLY